MEPRDANTWAKPIDAFYVDRSVEGAHKENVEGRKPTGPLQGFGQLWQKSYQILIPGPTPAEVIQTRKDNFGEFWYPSNKFYAPAAGIAPGEIAVIAGGRGPTKVIWTHTLTQLGDHFGSSEPVVIKATLIDKKRQWAQFGNIWMNSAGRPCSAGTGNTGRWGTTETGPRFGGPGSVRQGVFRGVLPCVECAGTHIRRL